eukprot:Gb_33671 [translate_table: standard]
MELTVEGIGELANKPNEEFIQELKNTMEDRSKDEVCLQLWEIVARVRGCINEIISLKQGHSSSETTIHWVLLQAILRQQVSMLPHSEDAYDDITTLLANVWIEDEEVQYRVQHGDVLKERTFSYLVHARDSSSGNLVDNPIENIS